MKRDDWAKLALIASIVYLARILAPAATFVYAVQREAVLAAWHTGNAVLLAAALGSAIGLSLGRWLKRLAQPA
jgi:hypothetical protein